MAKVRFNLEKPKSTEETLIRLVFRYSTNKKFVYSTKQMIYPKDWNIKKNEVRKTHPSHKLLNAKLKDIENTFESVYLRLSTENKDLNNDMLHKALDIELNRITVVVAKKVTFFDLLDTFINDNPNRVEKSTLKAFKQTKNKLQEYQQSRKIKTLDFDSFDYDWFDDFKGFVFDKNLTNSTLVKWLKIIKQVLQEGHKRKLHTNLDFKYFKVETKQSVHIYLNEVELKKLFDYNFIDESHRITRDLFLIGCYTGFRKSDFKDLQPDDIVIEIDQQTGEQIQFFEIYTQKTKQYIKYTIQHPFIKAILERYNGKAPTAKGIDLDLTLKEMGRIAGIDGIGTQSKLRANKHDEHKEPKHKFITTHTARRSFVTNALASGVDSEILRAATGHKDAKTLAIYNKLSESEKMKALSKTDFMTGKNINFDDVI